MKRGKRAQFYLIAASIIIFVIIGFAVVSNYVYVKSEPQKFYDIGDVLQREGAKVVEYAQYSGGNVNATIQTYLSLYQNYLENNLNSNFDLVIFYGNIVDGKISAQTFTRASLGSVTISFPGQTPYVTGGTEVKIKKEEQQVVVNPIVSGQPRTVNVTIKSSKTGSGFSITVPILEDNNFVFVMSSSDDFNNYIITSFPQNRTA